MAFDILCQQKLPEKSPAPRFEWQQVQIGPFQHLQVEGANHPQAEQQQ